MFVKWKFHILGFPNYKLGWTNAPNNPFNTKLLYLVKMLKNLGHQTVVYGVDGSEVLDADEFISVIDEKTFKKYFGSRNINELDNLDESKGEIWDLFIKNVIEKLEKNIDGFYKEFLINFLGYPYKKITDKFNDRLICVEPGIGHGGSYLPHRIFESHAWQNFVYGRETDPIKSCFPNNYDTVIPAYFDYRDYPFIKEKSDYYLYIGRIIWGKGLSVAIDITRDLGANLIVIGGGNINSLLSSCKNTDISHVTHLGVLSLKDKVKYLSNARALIYYSLYVEPFGHAPIESMFTGTPVITSNFGAFTETNVHNVTGFRVSTYEELFWACKNVDKLDPNIIREYAINNYSLEVVQKKYEQYFKKLYKYFNGKGWYYLEKNTPINLNQLSI